MTINKIIIRGCRYAYLDHGRGTAWLFIHGFPLDHRMWLSVIQRMSSQVRAIAPDLRGFGQSEAPVVPVVTMAEFADDLAALLDALDVRQPVVICGLSMGGYIAFEFWRRHRVRVGGLVLCDTRAASDTPDAARVREATAERVLKEGPSFLADSMVPRLLAPTTLHQQPEIAEQIRQQIMASNREAVAAAALGMAQRLDMQPMLGEITCPTLVLVGAEDVISPPAEMRSIAEAIPNAQFIEIAEAGHMAPLEKPGPVADAFLDFLRSAAISTKSN